MLSLCFVELDGKMGKTFHESLLEILGDYFK
jgi:hypothetical protein